MANLQVTRQDALRIAWERGLLDYKLHAGQRVIEIAVNASKGKLYVLNIARQFGKSFWAVNKAIKTAIKKKNSVIKIGTAFLSDLEEFILPTFERVFSDCPIDIRDKIRYDSKRSKFIFPNGSQIKLIGLDKKPNGLRGNTIDLIIIDECGFVGNLDYLYKSIIIPATIHRPDAEVILISTPPSSPDHPFSDYCQRAELEGCYSHFTIYDNPMVTPEMIEELIKESGGVDSVTWKREYLAQNVVDANLAIIPEWKDLYAEVEEETEYNQFYHNYEGMDLGVKDFTAVLFGHYNFKGAYLYIKDELTMNGPAMTTITLKDAILNKEKEVFTQPPVVYRRISDNNNLMLIQDLGYLHGLHFTATSKDSLDAMVNEVRVMVGQGKIKINPKCKKLIGCLKYGIWNNKRSEFSRSSVYGHFDHLAALIYLVRNLDKSTNPIPANYKIFEETHQIIKIHTETPNQRSIKTIFGNKFKN